MSVFKLVSLEASTGNYVRPFSDDRDGQIRSIGINNPSTVAMTMRMSDATAAESTLVLRPGTYTFNRVFSKKLEVQSNTTNTASINVWAGAVEDSA